jgi:hypothetical protein
LTTSTFKSEEEEEEEEEEERVPACLPELGSSYLHRLYTMLCQSVYTGGGIYTTTTLSLRVSSIQNLAYGI